MSEIPSENLEAVEERRKAARRERYQRYAEAIAPEDKCYIVVQGRPSAFYGRDGFSAAEELAALKTEETHEEHTVLSIPIASLEMALVAKYHGVVLHALSKLEEEDF
jgi:hypothetical protein